MVKGGRGNYSSFTTCCAPAPRLLPHYPHSQCCLSCCCRFLLPSELQKQPLKVFKIPMGTVLEPQQVKSLSSKKKIKQNNWDFHWADLTFSKLKFKIIDTFTRASHSSGNWLLPCFFKNKIVFLISQGAFSFLHLSPYAVLTVDHLRDPCFHVHFSLCFPTVCCFHVEE